MMKEMKRTVGAVALAVMMLAVGAIGLMAAVPSVMGAPGDDKLHPIWEEDMLTDLNFDRSYAYNTSEQRVNISWKLPDMWAPDIVLTDLWVRIKNAVTGFEVYILWLNGTTYEGAIPDHVIWEVYDGMVARTDYVINVTLVIYSNIDEKYYGDGDEWVFPIYDGRDMVRDLTADPSSVINDGTQWTNLSFTVMRTELDMKAPDLPFTSVVKFNLFSEATGEWVLPEGFGADSAVPSGVNAEKGMDVAGGSLIFWFNWTVPLDQEPGPYRLAAHVRDGWNYTEEENITVLTVVLRELPPMMTNRSINLHEDSFVNVDLNDHFKDPNGLQLGFWANASQFENITLVWMSKDKVNITAAPDWSGTEQFTIWVIDQALNNVSFVLDVNVLPAPDDLKASPLAQRTVMVPEDIGAASFDPLRFFYDPDGPSLHVVSLGWSWTMNGTGTAFRTPIWSLNDENFSVTINHSSPSQGRALMVADLEEGSFTMPITAWVGEDPVLNSTMVVEVVPVNDVPRPVSGRIEVVRNQVLVQDIRELFYDPDGPAEPVFVLNTSKTSEKVTIAYDNTTFLLTITPETNWTGTTTFSVDVTDGIGRADHILTVSVVLPTYKVSGKVTFKDRAVHLVNVSADLLVVTLNFGTSSVATDNMTFSYELELPEGTYPVTLSLNLPADKLYDAMERRSGYRVPTQNDIVLTSDLTLDIEVPWVEFVEENKASWADLDLDKLRFNEQKGGGWEVILPVKDGSKPGYSLLNLFLVIRNKAGKDTDNNEFGFVWNATSKQFSVLLDKKALENVSEGKLEYCVRDDQGNKSPFQKFVFKEKDKGASIITVIVLIVLIILVLIALVFIMRKPSEDEIEEPEAGSEDKSEPRTCPGCSEKVTDAEAKECPYCGESMGEE